MSNIKRHPDMWPQAEYNEHEKMCERRRAADPTIPRRERETYHIEVEK